MEYLNYLICFVLLAFIALEVKFIVKRNRTVKLSGKDDLFTFTLVIFFAILFFPFNTQNTAIESLRNILVYTAILGSAGIKRGLSEKGVEKLMFTIPWENIQKITINEHQVHKALVTIVTEKRNFKLFYSKYNIKKVVRSFQERNIEVLIDDKIEEVIRTGKC